MQLYTPLLAIHLMNYSTHLHHLAPWMQWCLQPHLILLQNADEFALQTFEHLQEATAFVRQYTGKDMQRMKRYYDSAVKP